MTLPQQLHRDNIVIDGLNASWFFDDRILQRLHQGGVTAVNATLAAWHGPLETLGFIGEAYRVLRRNRERAMQVLSVSDIDTAKKAGKVGMIFGFQDTGPLGDDLRMLEIYHRLGVRVIQLTYNTENQLGYGCQAPEDKGLKGFGREAVAEMNRLGILVDLSHCGPQTTLDAVDCSSQPVAFTHANSAAWLPSPRNKSDAAIRACAAKGGVIGAISVPFVISRNMPATLDEYLDAIDVLVGLAGIDHVGLGPDFMELMPLEVQEASLKDLPAASRALVAAMLPVTGFESVTEMPAVTAGLLSRGYGEKDVLKLIGANWQRLYGAVW